MKLLRSLMQAVMLLLLSESVFADVTLTSKSNGPDIFTIVGNGAPATVYYDPGDFEVVKTTAELFAGDVKAVSRKEIPVSDISGTPTGNIIIVGTAGNNAWLAELERKGKIDLGPVKAGWEKYMITLVDKPYPGVGKALIVAGSDRRGTAYGLLGISRTIGVSPWYWWLDAPVRHSDNIYLKIEPFVSEEPSVKYRGIFINDEDWGLYRWAKENFDKEFGNIGPRTYEKVCELLLRLQANYLCPAMHDATTAFHTVPENRAIADRYAIVMGSSHCEPLLFNTASEWHRDRYGEWDYIGNRTGVDSVLNARAAEIAPYENIYTLALRGLHDRSMNASNDMTERKDMLQQALLSQRRMIARHTGKAPEEIPQAFTPYKEVLDVYDKGLDLPDDVTIIWPDDNYGYMKRLSSPAEQKRSGRSGVYYHASYLGKPHDHLWMHTASPTVMYEELRKAYDMTADRIWLLNAGDIKSCEFAVDFFLAMAFDIESFNFDRAACYRTEWLCGMLGDRFAREYADMSDSFYRLAFTRRPEFMGWGYQWSTDKHWRERNTDTDFSLTNYREADRRIEEYSRIGHIADSILGSMSDEKERACFYQAMYYPVKGCELLNRMVLDGQRNRLYAESGRPSAKRYAQSAKNCYDSLRHITDGYNSLLDGKWDHVMTMEQGFASAYFELPELREAKDSPEDQIGVSTEQEDWIKGRNAYHILPAFNYYLPETYYVDVFNRRDAPIKWKATVSDSWINISKSSGNSTDERVEVSVDWSRLPDTENAAGYIDFSAGEAGSQRVLVSAFRPVVPGNDITESMYMENNGYIAIDAAGFHRKTENSDITMTVAPYLGCENYGVQLGNPAAPQQRTMGENTPRLEYDFYTFSQGSVDVYTYVLPVFTLNNDRGYAGHEQTNSETKYGVCIDDGPVMNPSTSSVEYAQIWYESALKNSRINKTTLNIDKPGRHTVKIICGDAGTVIQKIVLDFGGMKRSYMGPQPTKIK